MPKHPLDPPPPDYEPPRADDLPSDYPVETAAGAAGFIGVGYFGGPETARPSPINLPR